MIDPNVMRPKSWMDRPQIARTVPWLVFLGGSQVKFSDRCPRFFPLKTEDIVPGVLYKLVTPLSIITAKFFHAFKKCLRTDIFYMFGLTFLRDLSKG